MAVKFFGQFLVEKGVVSRERLLEALDLQQTTNLKFGEMALAMELLSEEEVERVHAAQRSNDMRFGDVAVKLGILTEEQVKQVLTRQQNSYLYIGEALVQVGALDQDSLAKHLEEFQADQAPYKVDKIAIPAGVPHPALWEVAADLTFKMFIRIAELPHRTEPCKVIERLQGNHLTVSLGMEGTVQARYYLSVSAGVQEAIARAILKEGSVAAEPEEVLDDTIMEFVNIICGNISAKGAQLGFRVDIAPPDSTRSRASIDVPEGHVGLSFPIHMVSGEKAELALFINKWGY